MSAARTASRFRFAFFRVTLRFLQHCPTAPRHDFVVGRARLGEARCASLSKAHARSNSSASHLDEEDGPLVFEQACKLGLEGIVSKRKDSCYNSGRSPHWIKSKNPNAPAVKREAEQD
jgi:ATP-dependent DNA ligase